MAPRVGCLVVLLAALRGGSALAQTPLDEARELYLEADFRGAAEAYEAVLEGEDLDVEEAAAAHAALAALRLMLGDEATARAHADAAVAIDPEVAAPDGAPEAATALLREAEAGLGGRSAELEIRADLPLRPGVESSIGVRLDPAPRLLVAELTLSCRSGDGPVEERGPPPDIELTLVVGTGSTRCMAAALSASGAPLLELERVLAVVEPDPRREDVSDPDPDPRPDPDPGTDQGPATDEVWPGWLWVGVGAGALVVAAVMTLALVYTIGPGGQVVLSETHILGW